MQQFCAGSPMDRKQLDVLGPFPISKKGNEYMFVLADQFCKWTECYPLTDQTAEYIASERLHRSFLSTPKTPNRQRAEF